LGNRARKVRCAKCAHEWMLDPDEVQPDESGAPEPVGSGAAPDPDIGLGAQIADRAAASASDASAAIDRAAEVERYEWRPRRGGLDRAATLVLAAMVMIGLVAGAFQYRVEIVRAVPLAGGLYKALHIPVNVLGIEIRKVEWRIETRNGSPVLIVKGEIANVARKAVRVPPLSLALRDAHEHELYRWTSQVENLKTVGPGEVTPFTTSLDSPPLDAHDLDIRFLSGPA
jgi:hypothetical protein